MKFTADSSVKAFSSWISGRLAKRLDAARDQLEDRIRKRFSRSARDRTSRPSEYPRSLVGHLVNSIHVKVTKGFLGMRRTGLHATVEGRGAQRHFAMEKTRTIISSSGKRIAIPVSLLARKMSSNGLGPRKFPSRLELKRVVIKGRKMSALVTKSSAVTKKISGTDHRVHYLLVRKATVRRRKGIADAMYDEFDWLGKFLTDRLD